MNNFVKKLIYLFLVLFTVSNLSFSQGITVSGSVSDENGSLIGVNILVKGKVQGTISDRDGNYTLDVNESQLTLVFSIVGYKTQEIDVSSSTSNLDVEMSEDILLGNEVVISASRIEQSILEAPVTIEKINLLEIQNSATADFMDQLEHIKGVKVSRGSLNFAAINTRGFATDANTRFVQLVDGMDTSAPLLNFPTGNLVGVNPLDIESIEIIPGASSALYGPNAFNGIMLMTSKNPFEYQGLSVQVMQGFTQSARGDNEKHPLSKYNIRYSKAVNDKLAIKVNFAYDLSEDWIANDYTTDAVNTFSTVNLSGQPNFNGLNLYGDEIPIILPVGALAGSQYASFGVLNLRRTGFPEESLILDNGANNLKYDITVNYRLNDNLEASVLYRKGGGSTIYTGTQKYALRDFGQEFYKFTLKSDKLDLKVWQSVTDAGNSYNLGALGAIMNEAFSPSVTSWVPTYLQTYIVTMQGYTPFPAGNSIIAHQVARGQADAAIPAIGSSEYNAVRDQVIAGKFQSGGASFTDNSKSTNGEISYKAADWLLVGANYRNYGIFTDGTVFNEDPDGDGVNERIHISEWGTYAQVKTDIVTDVDGDGLHFTGSLRYDKNENYDGSFTPRLALVYSFGRASNIRVSYQTGFRNPDTQNQYIFFPTGTVTLLGTARANAERYGIMEGGAWSGNSYSAYLNSGGSLDASGTAVGGNPALLQEAYVDYIQPERLKAFEIGYKGIIGDVMLADINYHKTYYTDMFGGVIVASKNPTTHAGQTLAPGYGWSLGSNANDDVESWGLGVGLTFDLGMGYKLTGNYNHLEQKINYASEQSTFLSYFNTPENMYTFTVANREVFKNFGFSASLRFQDEFLYESTFSNMTIPAYGSLDAQINYKIESLKTIVKLGGNHMGVGNNDYRSRAGGPFIGKTFYLSLTFDEFLN